MENLKKGFSNLLWTLVALILVMGAIALVASRQNIPVEATSVGSYDYNEIADGSTAYITTGGQTTGFATGDWGSVVLHIQTDASATTSTLTVYPQYSNELESPCSSVTSWFTGTDYIAYSSPAQYYVPIATTVNTTSSLPYTMSLSFTSSGSTTITGTGAAGASIPYVVTTTYNYGSATQMAAASAGYVAVAQSLALTGDTYGMREFTAYGRCMRLAFTVSYGTVTPTIYAQLRDSNE